MGCYQSAIRAGGQIRQPKEKRPQPAPMRRNATGRLIHVNSRTWLGLQLVITAPSWASIGDRETCRTPASTKQGECHGQEKTITRTEVARAAEAFKREAEKLPYGRVREELLLRARRLETASHIGKWISSPGLSPPT